MRYFNITSLIGLDVQEQAMFIKAYFAFKTEKTKEKVAAVGELTIKNLPQYVLKQKYLQVST